MDWILKIIGIALFVGIIALIFYSIIRDSRALRKGKKYLAERGYEFLEQRTHGAHYGLYFRADGLRIYAKYRMARDGNLDWIDGTPEERLQRKKNKQKAE